MPMVVSSTEPKKLRDLLPEHHCSTLPERYGCDVVWWVGTEVVGVQRKEIRDFIASVQDGRLAKEIGQMRQTAMPTIILEGSVKFSADGLLMLGSHGPDVTEKQYRGMVYSLGKLGVMVLHTASHRATAAEIITLMAWSQKDRHTSLTRRPGPIGKWGKADSREFQEHMLMGVPGVGPELAGRILDKVGGMPFAWRVSEEELMGVEGIGRVKARTMMEALG